MPSLVWYSSTNVHTSCSASINSLHILIPGVIVKHMRRPYWRTAAKKGCINDTGSIMLGHMDSWASSALFQAPESWPSLLGATWVPLLPFSSLPYKISCREHPAVVICISNQGSWSLMSMLTLPCCRLYPITEKQMVGTPNGGSRSQRDTRPHVVAVVRCGGRGVWRTEVHLNQLEVYVCVSFLLRSVSQGGAHHLSG